MAQTQRKNIHLDAVFILGASILLILLPREVWPKLPLTPSLVLLSYPHFVATYLIWLVKKRSWREEWWPVLFPCLFLAACLGTERLSLTWSGLPYKLTYLYLLYHFAQQTYGASLWLVYRNGGQLGAGIKRGLRAWLLLVPLCAAYQVEVFRAPSTLFFHPVEKWALPLGGLEVLWGLLGVCALLLLALIVRDYHRRRDKTLLWVLGTMALQLWWFLPPFFSSVWVQVIPLLHALQYVPFWSRLWWTRPLPWGHKALHYLGFMLGGYLLFRFIPWQGLGFGARWVALLNAHHFVIDGRIWKLRDERNRPLFESAREEVEAQSHEGRQRHSDQ